MKELVCPNKDEIDELMYLKSTILRIGLNKIGLYIGQPAVLDIVTQNPGLNQKVLSNMAGIKPSTVNVMLSRMAKNDLIEIKKDANNTKISRVYTTEKGKELAQKCIDFKTELDEIIYKDLTDKEITDLKNILSKINDNLKKELESEELKK